MVPTLADLPLAAETTFSLFAFGGEFPGEFAAAGVPVNQRGLLE